MAQSNLTAKARNERFRLRRFHALVILQCVRWYSKYTISYRQLEEMMAERGVVPRNSDQICLDYHR